MSSLVSVIIPCYNAEKFLDMSIGSVYEQEYPSVELIVVNDGSTDSSEEIILKWKNKFAEKNWSLKYIYQENKGQAAATSAGLKLVTGDYLSLLDADDRFLQGSLRLRAEFLDNHPDYAGVRSNGYYVKNNERILFVRDEKEKNITDVFTALSLGETNNWAGSYMVRTVVLFSFYPNREILSSRLGQNFQILLPVSYKNKFGFVDVPLMEYFQYENSHSHASDSEAQYVLSKKNLAGWKDIYFHILHLLTNNIKEIELYSNMYNSVFYRSNMNMALNYGDNELAKEYYKALKNTKRKNINDTISYYRSNKPILFVLKIIRRVSNYLKKE